MEARVRGLKVQKGREGTRPGLQAGDHLEKTGGFRGLGFGGLGV